MQKSNTEGIDIDLTILSSTMIYAEVYDMLENPEMYLDKIIRMHVLCATYVDHNMPISFRMPLHAVHKD